MTTYLIDYENVHHHGLEGINRLAPEDYVVLFLGKTNQTVHTDAAIAISRTPARVVWKKAEGSGRNYLDIQIASYLGSLIGENKGSKFVIVSGDQGFLAARDFWKEYRKDVVVRLQKTIADAQLPQNGMKKTAPPLPDHDQPADTPNGSPNGAKDLSEPLRPSVKKLVSAVLREHNLLGGNFKRVHDIIRKSKDDDQFVSVIENSYLGDKHRTLAASLLPAFRAHHTKQ
ncbi:MAG: hypothetical protein LBD25_02775 [Coriobacteriales bacterium]|jgi:hypothetical protein|nr:hypothetical protein [Coriobacteriales bacterium]